MPTLGRNPSRSSISAPVESFRMAGLEAGRKSLKMQAFRPAALVGAAPLAVLLVLAAKACLASAAGRNAYLQMSETNACVAFPDSYAYRSASGCGNHQSPVDDTQRYDSAHCRRNLRLHAFGCARDAQNRSDCPRRDEPGRRARSADANGAARRTLADITASGAVRA